MPETRVLILAPRGRDAAVACDLLRGQGVDCEICADLGELTGALDQGAGAVRAAYGPNWERLVKVKARVDPDNAFHRNHNIPPD